MATPHAPTPDITAPTTEQPANGTPLQRVPLPNDLLERIRAKATTSAPAKDVAQASASPIAQGTPAAPAEPPKPATPAPVTPPVAAAKPAEPAKVEPPAKKEGIAQVREALERAEAKARELESSYNTTSKEKAEAYAKIAEHEGKVKAWEERYSKELEPQIKQLTEKEKRLQEAEERLRVRDYTATNEWHDTIEKPIATAQQSVGRLLKQVSVTDPSTGAQRAATFDDYQRIAQIPYLNAREAAAKQVFGEGFVTTELVRLSGELDIHLETRKAALTRASVESEAYFKQQQERQQSDAARFRTAVEGKMASYLPKPTDADPEEQAAYAEGQKLSKLIADGVQDLDQRVDLSARILAMPVQERLTSVRLARVTRELAEAREQLKVYQRTDPDVATSGRGAPAPVEGDGTALVGQNPGLTNHLLSKFRGVATGKLRSA